MCCALFVRVFCISCSRYTCVYLLLVFIVIVHCTFSCFPTHTFELKRILILSYLPYYRWRYSVLRVVDFTHITDSRLNWRFFVGFLTVALARYGNSQIHGVQRVRAVVALRSHQIGDVHGLQFWSSRWGHGLAIFVGRLNDVQYLVLRNMSMYPPP